MCGGNSTSPELGDAGFGKLEATEGMKGSES
jgi:hypothetical protein